MGVRGGRQPDEHGGPRHRRRGPEARWWTSGEGRGRPIIFGFVPALDGLRALAVLGVMLYHGGAPMATGGFLSIDVFFVLSGFLITSLLLGEWTKSVTIRLGQFWARRARRLLPALLVMLVGVALYAKFFATPGEFAGLRLDSLSTLFYVANWHFIVVGGNYFNLTAQPSPLPAHVVAVHRGAVLHRLAPGGPAACSTWAGSSARRGACGRSWPPR